MRYPTKKLIVYYGILLLVVLISMCYIAFRLKQSFVQPRDYAEIKKEGILRITTEYNQAGYFIQGDTIVGFQYEICRAMGEIAGLEVEMQLEMSLPNSFQALQKNETDVIARSIPLTTNELNSSYLFTDPVTLSRQVLVQRTAVANDGKKPIRNQLELAKHTCYIPKDSPAKLRLQNMAHEISDTIHIIEEELYSSEQLIIMVAKGEIDYAVCDQQIAIETAKYFPEIDCQTAISFTQLQSWAIRADAPVLLDSINSWLNQLRERGDFDEIYKRYY